MKVLKPENIKSPKIKKTFTVKIKGHNVINSHIKFLTNKIIMYVDMKEYSHVKNKTDFFISKIHKIEYEKSK